MWSYYQLLLAFLMVFTGSFNTLSVKYGDIQIVPGEDGVPRKFFHPFVQSAFMFLGEALCLVAFKIAYIYYARKMNGSVDNHPLTKGTRNFNPFIFFIPALLDMIGTSIIYVALNLTYASSFQMLRGALIIFTGILSMGFLDRKFGAKEWSGIFLIIFGLALVGMSDFITKDQNDVNSNSIITGDLLIICAQVFTAIQMVVEEKFVAGQDIPALQAVGWEGIFGFISVCLLIIPLNYIHMNPPFSDNARGTLEAVTDAFTQIGNDGRLLMAIVGTTLSIAFFNFAGISVTKEISSTTRVVLDSIRTLVIWICSLYLQWQKFHYLQLIGFIILLTGICSYNNVVFPQLIKKCQYYLCRHRPPVPDEERVVNTAADDVEENR